MPALIFYALAGSSRHLIVGPMSATAALSAAIIMPLLEIHPTIDDALAAYEQHASELHVDQNTDD